MLLTVINVKYPSIRVCSFFPSILAIYQITHDETQIYVLIMKTILWFYLLLNKKCFSTDSRSQHPQDLIFCLQLHKYSFNVVLPVVVQGF